MALYLVTGQPGHGKTAYGLDKAFQFQKEGRQIYVHGVKDFDFDKAGMKYLDDPTKWQDLPDGSVILLDECYTVFPNRNPGARVPDHVEAMARHRHRGFDFILIAQQGLQLDPFLRGLYEEHCHVRQTSIMKSKTKLKRWNQYQGNIAGASSDVVDWVRPKYVFDYYTSTTLVTTKRSIPAWIRWTALGIVFVCVMLWVLKMRFDRKIEDARSVTTGASGLTVAPAAGGTVAPRTFDSPFEYAVAHLPRFATMPWTAPIYDGAAPASQPEIYCMSSMAGLDAQGVHQDASCSCYSEQGTKYEMDQPQCRTVARNSTPYNPYKAPRLQQYQGVPSHASLSSDVDAQSHSAPAAAVVGHAPGQRGDVFQQNPASTISGYTRPTSTL